MRARHQPASGEGLALCGGEASAGFADEKAAAGGFCWRVCWEALQGDLRWFTACKGRARSCASSSPHSRHYQRRASPAGHGTRSSLLSIPSQAGFLLYVLNVFSGRRKIN